MVRFYVDIKWHKSNVLDGFSKTAIWLFKKLFILDKLQSAHCISQESSLHRFNLKQKQFRIQSGQTEWPFSALSSVTLLSNVCLIGAGQQSLLNCEFWPGPKRCHSSLLKEGRVRLNYLQCWRNEMLMKKSKVYWNLRMNFREKEYLFCQTKFLFLNEVKDIMHKLISEKIWSLWYGRHSQYWEYEVNNIFKVKKNLLQI